MVLLKPDCKGGVRSPDGIHLNFVPALDARPGIAVGAGEIPASGPQDVTRSTATAGVVGHVLHETLTPNLRCGIG